MINAEGREKAQSLSPMHGVLSSSLAAVHPDVLREGWRTAGQEGEYERECAIADLECEGDISDKNGGDA